jgi:anti-sigma factor RsiW
MTNCLIVHENVFAYVEQELPAALIHELDSHIEGCAECASLVNEIRGMLALMEAQKSVEPRPFAETRILQGIETALENKQKSFFPAFARVIQPAVISIGLLAAMAIGYLIGSDFAGLHSAYHNNNALNESVKSELNVPDFMSDDIIYFTE